MDCIEILKELVRLDTTNPPGNEKKAAQYLAEILEPHGFQCEVQDLGDNRANLVAVLRCGNGPELMLNGHLDVVPAAGDWKTEPFSVVQNGDKLHGRGTSDMKGGIAAMCEAAIRIAHKDMHINGGLKLLFVADEECSNMGTLDYLEKYECGEFAIIGEPTGLEIAIAHRGVSRDYIDIYGEARHAALPEEEPDSVAMTALTIAAVQDINRKLQSMKHNVLPSPSVAITMIQGYEKDNIVPGTVRLLLDFRILPGMEHQQVIRILDEGFEAAGIRSYKSVPHFFMPGGEISPHDSFVELCLEEREDLFGKKGWAKPFDASCEQCFLVKRGVKALICGPGDIVQAHTVNEFVSEQQVRDAANLYERIIERVLSEVPKL